MSSAEEQLRGLAKDQVKQALLNNKIGMSPDERERVRKEAARDTSVQTIVRQARQESFSEIRAMNANAKVSRSGPRCIVIMPNGKMKKTFIDKGKEKTFFQSHFGDENYTCVYESSLAVGQLAGG